MIREALSHYGYGIWNALGMLLFLGIFLSATWRAFRPANRLHWEELSQLPLKGNSDD